MVRRYGYAYKLFRNLGKGYKLGLGLQVKVWATSKDNGYKLGLRLQFRDMVIS